VARQNVGGQFLFALVCVFFAALLWYGAVLAEGALLQGVVSPRAGMKIQVWLDEFMGGQIAAIAVAAVLGLLWHIIAIYSGGAIRGLWLILGFVSIAIAIGITALFLPLTQEGLIWAYLFSFINGGATYWIATVRTDGPCQYDPIGAIAIRRIGK
jgi:hypothetical protein